MKSTSPYSGSPPTDLDGGPRLRDYDGDGLAENDCGALESANAAPGDVQNLRWDNDITLLWDAEPSADEYHIYRDLLANLAFSSFGVCRDDLDGDRTDTQLIDMGAPAEGQTFFYLVTAVAGVEEGTLGFGTNAERSNFNPCP